ncbi:MAG: hypothetical protein AAB728_01990, partial [Patescibacteria group bacterium]
MRSDSVHRFLAISLIAASTVLLLPSRTALAAVSGDFHVSTANGNDTTGDGSSGSPWKTIQKGVNHLQTNGVDGATTIHTDQGTYAETVTIPALPGASATNTITIKPDAGEAVAVTSNGLDNAECFKVNGGSYVVIQGFELKNCDGHAVTVTNGAAHVTLDQLYIHDVGGSMDGVYVDAAGNADVKIKRS